MAVTQDTTMPSTSSAKQSTPALEGGSSSSTAAPTQSKGVTIAVPDESKEGVRFDGANADTSSAEVGNRSGTTSASWSRKTFADIKQSVSNLKGGIAKTVTAQVENAEHWMHDHAPDLHMGGEAKGHKNVFLDGDKMKREAHKNIDKPPYDVANFYHEEGMAQEIARAEWFSATTLAIISLNAIWIGIDADHNPSETLNDAPVVFQVAEHFFCVFFTGELLIRFMAFKNKLNCLKDMWFKFDTVLVGMMVLETWIMNLVVQGGGAGGAGNLSMLRLLRLLRLTRMARLMRSLPELMTVVKGMAAALRSVSSAMMMLVLLTYVFAIIFKIFMGDNEEVQDIFGTIPECMWTLLMAGTLLDNITDVGDAIREQDTVMALVFLLFTVMAAIMTMNMLIGILCEVISAVAGAEKEKILVDFVRERLLEILERLDTNGSKSISKDEFQVLLKREDAQAALSDLGVDLKNLDSLGETLFEVDDGVHKSLTYAEFMETMMQLRSDNNVSVAHMMDLQKFIRLLNRNSKAETDAIHLRQDKMAKDISYVGKSLKDIQHHLGLVGKGTIGDKKKKIRQEPEWKRAVDDLKNKDTGFSQQSSVASVVDRRRSSAITGEESTEAAAASTGLEDMECPDSPGASPAKGAPKKKKAKGGKTAKAKGSDPTLTDKSATESTELKQLTPDSIAEKSTSEKQLAPEQEVVAEKSPEQNSEPIPQES